MAPLAVGLLAFGASTLISNQVQKSAEKKNNAAANSAIDQAKKDAEQKALMETQQEQKNATARKALLDAPTSGFGPNTNLARSFLTTL